MAESNQSVLDDFSVPHEYDRREGTLDSGKDYEIKLTTLFSLLCANLDKYMWIGSNLKHCGDYDDIVLHREMTTGNRVTIMIQVKHQEAGKYIALDQFFAKKGDFSLQKHSKDLSCLKETIDNEDNQAPIIRHLRLDHEKIFVIFTNKGSYEYQFFPEVEAELDLSIFNISGKTRKFRFHNLPTECSIEDSDNEYLNNLFLFTNQLKVKQLDKPIRHAMEELLKPLKLSERSLVSLIDKFTSFVKSWANGYLGGHYPLTKDHVIKVLASLLLEPYEVELRIPEEGTTIETTGPWNEIISTKSATVIDADETTIQFVNQHLYNTVSKLLENNDMQSLWEQNRKLVKRTMFKDVLVEKQINFSDLYEYLWKNRQVPLVLKTNDAHILENLQYILKFSAESFRVIILTKFDSEQPQLILQNTFMNLQDLNEQHQQVLLQLPVKLQDRQCNALHKLVSAELFQFITVKDIIYILLGKFNIGEDAEPLPEFFVDRSILKVYIRANVLEKVENDIFVIKCTSFSDFEKFTNTHNLHISKSSILQKHKVEIDAHTLNKFRIIISDDEVNLENVNRNSFRNKPVHCFTLHDNSYLEWKKSFGSIDSLRPYRLVNYSATESEIEIFSSYCDETLPADNDLENNESEIIGPICPTLTAVTVESLLKSHSVKERYLPLLISADPGMGKSVLMNYIALNMPLDIWVVRINLIQHTKYFNNENFELLRPSEHLHYFTENILAENSLSSIMFKIYQETRNVILLFDGFDEIPITFRENVTQIVKSLHDWGYFICLTTRPVAKIQLEEVLNTFAVDIVPFSENNQSSFLISYFNATLETDIQNKKQSILIFVKKLLKATKKNFNAFDNEFMGVPLQTKLLAEVFTDSCETFLSTNTFENENFDMLSLYENFIKKKEKIICDKFGECSKDDYIEYINYRTLIALQLLFEEHDLKELEITNKFEGLDETFPHKLQKVQKDGIVIAESKSNIWFAHRTFAEYFSAQWLSENINGKHKNLVQKLVQKLFQPNYIFIRNLFDRIVAKDCVEHLLVINDCASQVMRNITSNPNIITEVDKCGRTVIHLMASRGIPHRHSTESAILKILHFIESLYRTTENDPTANYFKTPSVKINNIKDDLGYTPLDYSLFSRCYNIANVICMRVENVNDSIVYNSNSDCKLICDFLTHFDDFNYRPLMSFMLKNIIYNDINTAIDKLRTISDHNIALHSAIAKNIGDLHNLLTSTVDINQADNEGYTPLHFAVILTKKETVNVLLDTGSDVNVQDKSGKTALHWACATGDIHSVNLLLSKNAHVNVTDNNGMTPIHYAVMISSPSQKDIVAKLLEKEEAINVSDNFGNTALQYCIYYSGFHTLSTFINHLTPGNSGCTKFDANVIESQHSITLDTVLDNRNSNGETMLHWAAEYNFTNILSLIQDRAQLSAIKDSKGNTPLHFAAMRGHSDAVNLLLSNGSALKAEEDRIFTARLDATNARHPSYLNLYKEPSLEQGKTDNHTTPHTATINGQSQLASPESEESSINARNNTNCSALHIAVQTGHLEIVSLLLSNKADIDAKDTKNWTALHIATQNGHLEIVSELLCKGADVDVKTNENQTALYIASKDGHLGIASLLLSKGAKVDMKLNRNWTALHIAAQKGHFEIASLLVSPGVDVDAKTAGKHTALFIAAQNGHFDIVKLLLSKGAIVDTKDNDSWTPLYIAAQNGHLEIVSLLLFKGAEIDTKTIENYTALYTAAKNGHLDIVSLLVNKRAKVNMKLNRNWIALHIAAQTGHLEIAKLLLSEEVDVNATTAGNHTPLFMAAQNGHSDVLQWLISEGADADAKDNDNWTALHIAAKNGHLNVVSSLLLSEKVDIDAKTIENETSLYIAAENGHLEIVSQLVNKGAKVGTKLNRNWTPLHIAAQNGHLEIAKLLLSDEVDVDAKTAGNHTALFLAAQNGHLDMVQWLRTKGADVDAKDNNHWTPLYAAAQNGHLNIVSLLLAEGVDVNAKTIENETSLYTAAQNGHLEIVSLLVNKEAEIDVKTNENYTALYIAAQNGHLEIVSLLINNGAKVGTKLKRNWTALHIAARNGHLETAKLILSEKVDIDARTAGNHTALFIAAQNGHSDVVEWLLSKGADVNGKDNNNWTALYVAAQNRHLNVVSLILSQGVDIDAKTVDNETSLYTAAQNGHLEIVSLLVNQGAKVGTKLKRSWTALHIAARNGHLEIAKLLLSEEVDIDTKTAGNHTALFIAAQNGHLDVVQWLLSQGADIDAKDHNNWTALYIAAQNGHLKIVSLLLSEGVDVDARTIDNETSLYTAAQNGHLDVVSLLVNKGANVSTKFNRSWTALHIATRNGHLEIAKLLLSGEVDVDTKTGGNHTPLFLAAQNGHFNVVQWLLSEGAGLDTKDNDNWTALYIAAQNGHFNVVSLLLSNGADVNAKTIDNETPLYTAAQYGHLDILSLLVNNGAEVEIKTSEDHTALDIATQNGHLEIVSLLVNKGAEVSARTNVDSAAQNGLLNIMSLLVNLGAEVDTKTSEDQTAVDGAAQNKLLDIVANKGAEVDAKACEDHTALNIAGSMLVDKRVAVSETTDKNWTTLQSAANKGKLNIATKGANNSENVTPLQIAALKGHTQSMEVLLSHGTTIGTEDGALHAACMYTICADAVNMLLSKGAYVEARDDAGRTPLHVAAEYGHLVAVSLLLDNGADIEAKSNENWTPLHAAAASTNSDVLPVLLNRKAYIEAKDNQHRTPLHIASICGLHDSISLLLRKGANINQRDNAGKTALYYAANRNDINIVALLLNEGADL